MTRPDTPRALVTGGNRGIGRAIAAALIAEGCAVTITARDPAAGEAAAEALGCDWMRADVAEPETLHGLIDMPFDILVNNAGILPEGSLLDNPEGFVDAMAVMVTGPFLLIRALAPGMGRRGWGRIVNLSSSMGSFASGLSGPNGYGIAKAALNALTHVLPRDLPEGVKINAMDPGWVATRMGGEHAPGDPEDAAAEAVRLALLPEDGPTGGFWRHGYRAEW
ncbi:SDR family NAD(P)-dependent oxidoreductase [Roseicyclus sp. F158]|uniref:SDR family NAD(P)-dependent oxidoreductase n=1 Tax=Tropicimonas omnivorans TaxID=3075590 RepID=A0ABU3DGI5_9RHOB|nr:SDR family NAD(P)-dependent oxidoreductase [Roseicyclus sp. F158]MDT0682809.1 SDR family NAD(P)-dependent oxidoreductase [Roseicyclus sp. F158]